MGARSDLDRVQHDGDQLDEVVLSGVVFHIERMSHHNWWMAVHDPDTGERMDVWWNSTGELHTEGDTWANIEVINREPLSYDCPVKWTDKWGDHQCEWSHQRGSVRPRRVRHVCECGHSHTATVTADA